MESFTVNRFDGGLWDNHQIAPTNAYAKCNNLIPFQSQLVCRDGFYAFETRIAVSQGNSRISGLYVDSEPFGRPIGFRADKAYNINESSTWTEIYGPDDNVAVPNKTVTDFESAVLWQKQIIYASGPSTVLPHRIYCTDLSPTTTFLALTLGLPSLASDPTITAGSAGTTYSYIYAFHYYYTFTDYDGTTYEESGPVTQVTATAANAITTGAANTMSISAVPTLANTSSTNYDVSTDLKIKVFRTINDGSTFYLVTTLDNGTTTYDDTTTDSDLDDAEVIYTDGGIVENVQPLIGSKYCTQANGFFWFATDRVLIQSKEGAPGACPSEYEHNSEQRIRGLNSIISFPILFCDNSIYRIEGNFDEFGDGGFFLREIHKTAGCISHRSVVSVPGGLVWAGNGGFYFTDGYNVRKISTTIEYSTYGIWKNSNIVGAYDSVQNIIFWTVSSSMGNSSGPNDLLACLHLDYGLKEDSVFSTQNSANNIFPTCVAFSESTDVDDQFRGKLLVGDARGYLFYQDPTAYTDPHVDPLNAPEDWATKTIIYRYESAGLNLGDDANRSYCVDMSAQMAYDTDIAVKFYSRRDDGGAWGAFSEFKKDGAIVWGYTDFTWDLSTDPTDIHVWGSHPLVEGVRGFPAGTLRSYKRQIGVTNSKTWITKSDDLGTATISVAALTVTLDDNTQHWPYDCEGYELTFSEDSYDFGYVIASRDSDTQVTVFDPYDDFSSFSDVTAIEWQMRGYRKFERLRLLSYTINFDREVATKSPNRGTASEVNA